MNINYYYIYVLFISVTGFVLSQNYPESSDISINEIEIPGDNKFDSLKSELSGKVSPIDKTDLLNDIAWHLALSYSDYSIIFADSAIKLAIKNNYAVGNAKALNNKGEALRNKGLFEKSLNEHQNALKIFIENNDELNIAQTESQIGISYFNLSDFSKSFKHFDNAKQIFEKYNNLDGLINVTSYIGVVFNYFGQHEKAIEYFGEALENSIKTGSPAKQATLLNNIALSYVDLKKYEDAIKYYEKAMKIFNELGDIFNYSISLGNIGIPYSKIGEYGKADDCFNRSLDLATQLGDNYGIAHQYGNLGELYLNMANDDNIMHLGDKSDEYVSKSINFLELSVKTFDKLDALEDQKESLYMLSDAYSLIKNYKKSLDVYKNAKSIQDSIQTLENKKIIADLEIKQELDNKKKEIELLNKEKVYQSQITTFLITGAALLIFVAILILYFLVKKRKDNLLLQKNITMRMEVEENLRNNELELKNHKNNLEKIVKNRTKELQEEIIQHQETEEALLQAIERAEIANNAKSVFLANMSHELRTPLVGILGYSDLLMSTLENEESKEMADGINRTGNRLLNTLSLVLDLARIESDKFEIEISQVDIIKELKETYLNFKAMAEKKGLKLILDIHTDHFIIPTDVSMIKVILDNLVNNAIKFTREGEIKIVSGIDNMQEEPRFILKVIDSGVGIKRKNIPLIFEEFKQLSEGLTKDFQGSGLGLSITKKFVNLLGGSIKVESEFGEGSTFIISFPIEVKAVA